MSTESQLFNALSEAHRRAGEEVGYWGTRYIQALSSKGALATARRTIRVHKFERDTKARTECIRQFGAICIVCGFDFEARYGTIGEGFIHVRHLYPISLTYGEYQLVPIRDLRPVYPHCHAMLHREEPVLTLDELRSRLR